jgi:outer membrane protein assembly factor BamA
MQRETVSMFVLLAASVVVGDARVLQGQADAAPLFKLVAFNVAGSERYGQPAVLAASGLKLGTMVSADDLQAAMQRLTDTGAFASIQYQANEVGSTASVTFRLLDSKQFVACRFANLVWLPEAEVLKELSSRVPLFAGEVSTDGHMADRVSAALEAMLEERGITAKADYTPWFEPGASVPSALVFRIRGPSLPVREIQFRGAVALDQPTLGAAVQQLFGSEYDQLAVQEFVKTAVLSLYQQRGYLRASLGLPEVEVMGGGTAGPVRVVIPVTEGGQYKLATIQWSGDKSIREEELAACIKLEAGKPADQSGLQQGVTQAAGLYSARGFVAAHISTRATFDDAARMVSFTLMVDEGDQYHMGQLQVNGIDPEHVAKVLRDTRLRAGDPYDATYWARSFIAQVARDLPHDPRGWNAQFNPVMNRDSKTVDMTVNFVPGNGSVRADR